MSRALSLLLLLTLTSCINPLELGERRYREGDRLAALESWRSVRSDSLYYEAVQRRIREVEDELEQLVVLFKKRGGYYERKGRLAESVLNYRLALKLQPDDRATLDRVQSLVRRLAALSEEARTAYAEAFEAGDLTARPEPPGRPAHPRPLRPPARDRRAPARGHAPARGEAPSGQGTARLLVRRLPERGTRLPSPCSSSIRTTRPPGATSPSSRRFATRRRPPPAKSRASRSTPGPRHGSGDPGRGLLPERPRRRARGESLQGDRVRHQGPGGESEPPDRRAHLSELRGRLPSVEALIQEGQDLLPAGRPRGGPGAVAKRAADRPGQCPGVGVRRPCGEAAGEPRAAARRTRRRRRGAMTR